MKQGVVICFLVFSNSLFSQSITGVVKDSKTNELLPYVNMVLLSQNKGTTTNSEGNYTFNIDQHKNDTLKVSFMGYKPVNVPLSNFSEDNNILNISLEENVEAIEEVIVQVKKAKYGLKKAIGINKKLSKYGMSVQFGFESCLLVKNEKNNNGRVTKIAFFLDKNEQISFRSYPTYYRVNFYEYDEKLGIPGRLLSYKPILIKPQKNKKQKIVLNLKDNHVLFPKSGLCVGIETVNPLPDRKINKIHTTYPNLVWTYDDDRLTWMSFMSRPWWERKYKIPSKRPFSKRKYFYTNPLIHVEVQYRK